MRSFVKKPDNRRAVYLGLVQQIESQIREAYAERYEQGIETQASLGEKIGVHKSAINRRLSGKNNLTLKTVADLVWALGQSINVEIFDPDKKPTNRPHIRSEHCDGGQWVKFENLTVAGARVSNPGVIVTPVRGVGSDGPQIMTARPK